VAHETHRLIPRFRRRRAEIGDDFVRSTWFV
jgi:hypothetical protein